MIKIKFFILILIISNSLYSINQVSHRIKSIGENLKWFINDDYSTIFINPYYMNKTNNFILSNLSDLSNNQSSLLLGGIYSKSSYKAGLILEYNESDEIDYISSSQRVYDYFSDPENSYYYASTSLSWYHYPYNNRTILYDFDNEDVLDDILITEQNYGIDIGRDGWWFDRNIILLYSNQNFGIIYSYLNFLDNEPQHGYKEAKSIIKLVENWDSEIESFESEQNEINKRNYNIKSHSIRIGVPPFGKKNIYELVFKVDLLTNIDNHYNFLNKNINLDPDNDNELAYLAGGQDQLNNFNYQYLSNQEYETTGYGFGLYFSRLNTIKIKNIINLNYQYMIGNRLDNTNSKTIENFINNEEPDTTISMIDSLFYDTTQRNLNITLGIGSFKQIDKNFSIYYGLILYNNIFQNKDEDEYSINTFFDSGYNSNIFLPVGAEYYLKDYLVLRLGGEISYNKDHNETESNYIEILNNYSTTNTDIIKFTSSNFNYYFNYGFGININNKYFIDFFSTYNYNRISLSSFYLSIIYKY